MEQPSPPLPPLPDNRSLTLAARLFPAVGERAWGGVGDSVGGGGFDPLGIALVKA